MYRFSIGDLISLMLIAAVSYGRMRCAIGDRWDDVLIPGTCVFLLVAPLYVALSRHEKWRKRQD